MLALQIQVAEILKIRVRNLKSRKIDKKVPTIMKMMKEFRKLKSVKKMNFIQIKCLHFTNREKTK